MYYYDLQCELLRTYAANMATCRVLDAVWRPQTGSGYACGMHTLRSAMGKCRCKVQYIYIYIYILPCSQGDPVQGKAGVANKNARGGIRCSR